MALSGQVRHLLADSFCNNGAANELADAVDAMTGGNAVLSGVNHFTAADTFSGGVTVDTVGATITDVDVALSATTGTKLGTAVTQKLGFWGKTPVVQPAAALQGAVTDSTASAATGTMPAVRTDTLAHAAADAADGLHVLFGLVDAMRTALVNSGIMKGAA